MESESIIFHSRIPGRCSYWWEGKTVWRGKVMVLGGRQASNTCTSTYFQRQAEESRHMSVYVHRDSTALPLLLGSSRESPGSWLCPGTVTQLDAALGNYWCGSALALNLLFTAWISLIFCVTAFVCIRIVLLHKLWLDLSFYVDDFPFYPCSPLPCYPRNLFLLLKQSNVGCCPS